MSGVAAGIQDAVPVDCIAGSIDKRRIIDQSGWRVHDKFSGRVCGKACGKSQSIPRSQGLIVKAVLWLATIVP